MRMHEDHQVPTELRLNPACKACGGPLTLVVSVPKQAGEPRADIFRCVNCGRMNWIKEQDA